MATASIDQLLLRLLESVALFGDFDRRELVTLLAMVHKAEFPARGMVFNEGESGEALYVLVSGELEVFRLGARGRERRLALIEAGGIVGELALVESTPQSTSVRASSPCLALRLARSSLHAEPALAAKLYRNLARVLAQRVRVV